jgi:hypothetical protein
MNLERNTTVNCFRTKGVGGSFIWGTGRGLRVIADRRVCGNVLQRAYTNGNVPIYIYIYIYVCVRVCVCVCVCVSTLSSIITDLLYV